MGLIFNALLTDIIAVLIAAIIGILTYYQWAYAYWKRRNVPYIQPKFPLGTLENPFTRKEYFGIRMKRHYDELKAKGHKHGGLFFFWRPAYLVIDPEYVKNVMTRDFQYFTDRGVYYNEKVNPLSAHLFSLEGPKWKHLRAKLTPTFTSGKMKMMFQTLIACSDQLVEAMDKLHEKHAPVDIKDVLACFSTDVIGSCAFGIDCNSFKDPNSDFRRYGKRIFSPATRKQALRNAIAFANHKLGRRLGISAMSPDIVEFFLNVVKETVKYREDTNNIRNDFMQLLIDLKNNKPEGANAGERDNLTIEQVAAQAFVFFAAGFETSSSAMSFCLYELALNPALQQRARDEVNRMYDQNGKFSYDAIMELKYMGQIVDETLRKYPPGGAIPRKCVQDYEVANSGVIIEKGTTVWIPIMALQHDPEFFPDPEKFDPERFSEENRSNITPYTYIPFGEGPRMCIGARFGLMQTKVGLAVLLRNFKFSINKKTGVPLVLDQFSFISSAKGGIWLDIEKIA